ncbi:lysophospholipid acyltransferase family protein [Nesterenkonia muleiensis]|uniref:lysophospholipid acyltransferase family protein n=1 Tax=Nesterenkonia muleiensis TaxID=2282648 RepID=UPI000E73D38D|nr:lysophospholipid acyltransferase family protein [Nesterenkonia muleiensis]
MNTAPQTPDSASLLEVRTAGQERIRRIGGRTARLLCRPTITGLENVPETGGFIVASNHLSFLDSVLIAGIFPRPVGFFAKAEYFTQPGLLGRGKRFFFESFGSVPVDRDEHSGAVEALYRLTSIIEAGNGVGIYPEGTRSRDGRLYRGKNGVGWLALATGAPVVPVGLRGTEKLQAPDKRVMRPAPFQMRIGQPLQFDQLGAKHSMKPRKAATGAVMDAIAALSGQERVDAYNVRPAEPAPKSGGPKGADG